MRNKKGQFVKGEYIGFGFKKGQKPWNKGIKGTHFSRKTEFKKGLVPWNAGMAGMGICKATSGSIKKGERRGIATEFNSKNVLGKNNFKWRGNRVGYFALHSWINRRLGKAIKCADCGKVKGRIEWANKSSKYKRIFRDWISLCKKCHAKYDKKSWGNATKLWKLNKKKSAV